MFDDEATLPNLSVQQLEYLLGTAIIQSRCAEPMG